MTSLAGAAGVPPFCTTASSGAAAKPTSAMNANNDDNAMLREILIGFSKGLPLAA
jgi:hypothetical protein